MAAEVQIHTSYNLLAQTDAEELSHCIQTLTKYRDASEGYIGELTNEINVRKEYLASLEQAIRNRDAAISHLKTDGKTTAIVTGIVAGALAGISTSLLQQQNPYIGGAIGLGAGAIVALVLPPILSF